STALAHGGSGRRSDLHGDNWSFAHGIWWPFFYRRRFRRADNPVRYLAYLRLDLPVAAHAPGREGDRQKCGKIFVPSSPHSVLCAAPQKPVGRRSAINRVAFCVREETNARSYYIFMTVIDTTAPSLNSLAGIVASHSIQNACTSFLRRALPLAIVFLVA